MQDRVALRRELRAARRATPPAGRIAAAETLASRLLALPFAPATGHVAGYWAMDGEIALHAWQLRLPGALHYCLPVLGEDGCLHFAPWRPGQPLRANRFGIPEPEIAPAHWLGAAAMMLVIVPLVGFDRYGNRLGMGGGWYDRTFAFRRGQAPPPWLVGAAFASQEIEALAPQSWDVRLDAVCSERDTFLSEVAA